MLRWVGHCVRHAGAVVVFGLAMVISIGGAPVHAASGQHYDYEAMWLLVHRAPAQARAESMPFLEPQANATLLDRRGAARIVAISLAMQGANEQALRYAELAFDLARDSGDQPMMAGAKVNVANIYNQMGDVAAAARAYQEGANIAKRAHDVSTWSKALTSLGSLMLDYGNSRAALDLLTESRKIADDHAGAPLFPQTLIDIAEAQGELGQDDQALLTIRRAAGMLPADQIVYQTPLAGITAQILLGLGRVDEAEAQARHCLRLADQAQLDANRFDCLDLLAQIAVRRGDRAQAASLIASMNALVTAAATGPGAAKIRNQLSLTMRKADLARLDGRADEQAALMQTALKLRGDLDAARSQSAIALAAASFAEDGKDLSISMLEQRNAFLALRAREQAWAAAGSLGGAVLLGVIAVLLWRSNVTGKRLNEALERLNQQRETLARDIQHRAKNNLQIILSLLNLQARRQRELIGADSEGTGRAAHDLIQELRNRIDAMSHVHAKLYEGGSSRRNVAAPAFLGDLVGAIERSYGNQRVTDCHLTIAPAELRAEAAIPIGLLASELVSNVHKHAGATRLDVTLEANSAVETLTLIVADNGGGVENSGGDGFELIHDLAAQLYGQALLKSGPGGTVWRIVFPARYALANSRALTV